VFRGLARDGEREEVLIIVVLRVRRAESGERGRVERC
jgi:hypothetical protein